MQSSRVDPKTSLKKRDSKNQIIVTPIPRECKRYMSHNQKVVATSPATRQTSPIFSNVPFGDTQIDSNKSPITQTALTFKPTTKQQTISQIKPKTWTPSIRSLSKERIPTPTITSRMRSQSKERVPNTTSTTTSTFTSKVKSQSKEKISTPTFTTRVRTQSKERIPTTTSATTSATTSNSRVRSHSKERTPTTTSTFDKKPIIKTEIKTPNGSVLKRSGVTSDVNNGVIHRNTVSFPIQSTNERNVESSRLSVNVSVAVGLQCDEEEAYGETYEKPLIGSDSGEDEIDWGVGTNGFALNVAVRLRPFIESEIESQELEVIEISGNTVRIINTDIDKYNRMEYGFGVCLNSSDRDLFEFADQDTVFKKMGEPLLEKALEGYNVCLFAYGHTGSGKSFTMMGSETNPGIIPRFVNELYKRMLNLTETLFAVEVSYYEIYNERIYDLLSDDKDYNKKVLRIREHPHTGPYVENLTQHNVNSTEEIMDLIRRGNRRRAVASTSANTDSSRSHSILTIILSQLRNNCNEMDLNMSYSCGSRINLIDLAGSERMGNTNASEERFKEGSLINKSLMNLGRVISKLADYSKARTKTAHIPYRDSPLTWLLKESLGGNSQTSMIATISPAKCYLDETVSTLSYAAIARRIVNYVHINEDPKTKKIRELMAIISELRAQQKLSENTKTKDICDTNDDNRINTGENDWSHTAKDNHNNTVQHNRKNIGANNWDTGGNHRENVGKDHWSDTTEDNQDKNCQDNQENIGAVNWGHTGDDNQNIGGENWDDTAEDNQDKNCQDNEENIGADNWDPTGDDNQNIGGDNWSDTGKDDRENAGKGNWGDTTENNQDENCQDNWGPTGDDNRNTGGENWDDTGIDDRENAGKDNWDNTAANNQDEYGQDIPVKTEGDNWDPTGDDNQNNDGNNWGDNGEDDRENAGKDNWDDTAEDNQDKNCQFNWDTTGDDNQNTGGDNWGDTGKGDRENAGKDDWGDTSKNNEDKNCQNIAENIEGNNWDTTGDDNRNTGGENWGDTGEDDREKVSKDNWDDTAANNEDEYCQDNQENTCENNWGDTEGENWDNTGENDRENIGEDNQNNTGEDNWKDTCDDNQNNSGEVNWGATGGDNWDTGRDIVVTTNWEDNNEENTGSDDNTWDTVIEVKPKLVSTATEMSFIEPQVVDSATNTSFVETPTPTSRFDLNRFQRLKDQENKLLDDIRSLNNKMLKQLKTLSECQSIPESLTSIPEDSSDPSDNYQECNLSD